MIDPSIIRSIYKRPVIRQPLKYDESAGPPKFSRPEASRGLRHFSAKVCDKVREKGHTNYNEVAEELVNEYFDSLPPHMKIDPEKLLYEEKNIRRRVYDALNVLMAMNIIEKEKKEIRWVGLPTSSLEECKRMEHDILEIKKRINKKKEQLKEFILQLVSYRALIERNHKREIENGCPPQKSILYLPFLVISTDKETMVNCAISPNRTELYFNFNRPFELLDDIEVLKRIGLTHGLDTGNVNPQDVQMLKSFLPPALRDHIDQIIDGSFIVEPEEPENDEQLMEQIDADHNVSTVVGDGSKRSTGALISVKQQPFLSSTYYEYRRRGGIGPLPEHLRPIELPVRRAINVYGSDAAGGQPQQQPFGYDECETEVGATDDSELFENGNRPPPMPRLMPRPMTGDSGFGGAARFSPFPLPQRRHYTSSDYNFYQPPYSNNKFVQRRYVVPRTIDPDYVVGGGGSEHRELLSTGPSAARPRITNRLLLSGGPLPYNHRPFDLLVTPPSSHQHHSQQQKHQKQYQQHSLSSSSSLYSPHQRRFTHVAGSSSSSTAHFIVPSPHGYHHQQYRSSFPSSSQSRLVAPRPPPPSHSSASTHHQSLVADDDVEEVYADDDALSSN